MRYHFGDKRTKKIKKICDELLKIVPQLNYIEPEDFDIVVAVEISPKNRMGNRIVAEIKYVTHWLADFIGEFFNFELPKYIIFIYPSYYIQDTNTRFQVLIHELWHIAPSKHGVRPHTGFGDELIVKMLEKSLRRIRRVINEKRAFE